MTACSAASPRGAQRGGDQGNPPVWGPPVDAGVWRRPDDPLCSPQGWGITAIMRPETIWLRSSQVGSATVSRPADLYLSTEAPYGARATMRSARLSTGMSTMSPSYCEHAAFPGRRVQDRTGPLDLFPGRGVPGADHRDLRGMDGHLGVETDGHRVIDLGA